MKWASLLVFACGCNDWFGIQSTELFDAPPATPPIDAPPPPVCPALGTALTFSGDLHQLPARGCQQYTPSRDTGMATAVCNSAIALGSIDHELTPVTLTPPPTLYFDEARLGPEGDRMVVTDSMTAPPYYQVSEYRVDAGGTWTSGSPAPLGANYSSLSTPSRGPDRRAVYMSYDSTLISNVVVEMSDATGTWSEMMRYSVDELGVTDISEPSLSSDGLRMVFMSQSLVATPGKLGGGVVVNGSLNGTWIGGGGIGSDAPISDSTVYDQPVYYTDRSSTSEHFRMAQPLTTVPSFVAWPYVTEDCGRIYFSALETVFYLKQ